MPCPIRNYYSKSGRFLSYYLVEYFSHRMSWAYKHLPEEVIHLVKFLEKEGVKINNLNVTIPPEYVRDMNDYEVVEGECKVQPDKRDIAQISEILHRA